MTQGRAIRTRERVLDAAAEGFASRGYLGTTLLEVIERTGMTKGALYGHFSSKDELAATLIEEAGGEVVARAVRRTEHSGSALHALRGTMLDLSRHLRHDARPRAALRLAVEVPHLDRREPGLVERICRQLTQVTREALADRPTVVTSLPPETIARLLVSILLGVPHPVPRDDEQAERWFDDLWETVSGPLSDRP